MNSFCETYALSSLLKEPICYKNPQNPLCMDLILTICPYSLQNSCVIRTGSSDFHKTTVTVMKSTYEKLKVEITNYRDYKNFCNDRFRQIHLEKLSTKSINTTCINTLNIFVPSKEKILKRK